MEELGSASPAFRSLWDREPSRQTDQLIALRGDVIRLVASCEFDLYGSMLGDALLVEFEALENLVAAIRDRATRHATEPDAQPKLRRDTVHALLAFYEGPFSLLKQKLVVARERIRERDASA